MSLSTGQSIRMEFVYGHCNIQEMDDGNVLCDFCKTYHDELAMIDMIGMDTYWMCGDCADCMILMMYPDNMPLVVCSGGLELCSWPEILDATQDLEMFNSCKIKDADGTEVASVSANVEDIKDAITGILYSRIRRWKPNTLVLEEFLIPIKESHAHEIIEDLVKLQKLKASFSMNVSGDESFDRGGN